MKNKFSIVDLFELFTVFITILVIAFTTTVILAILIYGFPFLGAAFYSEEVRFSLKLSLYTASISTMICIFLAIPTAYTLTRTAFPFKKIVQIILEMPLSMPYLVLGLSLLIIFSSDFGKMLKELGFKVVFDKNGIIMAQTVVNLPYVIRFIRTAFAEVDQRLEFIAGCLGASKWERFITITLPLSKNAIITMIILTWSRALGEFGATLMLVGATRMKTETLTTSVYLNLATGDMGASMASASIILFVSFVALFITSWIGRKNKQESRMKDVNIW
ncbi:ABC transporter permease [Acetobacterium woodii]|uniref:Molybdate/tungsten ABC transport system permease protein ModB1 n=1 Tax=Acetobacterium woodii (strain ATCC 29683 / DSM 1030 / JCM 2381 / KCTC 1655 / WB1) TaxID=931626 RepID=H6LCZ0_ACEWD|nr:ABC transporter permease [Acetobacterium woodii]AFA47829.1 molybdate/tungsten ABC transport system permease protein ModB1 [Acetobacterium woodii DSM 1030]